MNNKKVLIVDDEEHIVELLKFNLETEGYKVSTANNGIDAVKLVQLKHPDILLLDLMLPGMDGYDVCKAIKSNKEISNTPIIMLTAKGEEFDKVLGLELGADDYMTKPFSIRELQARVKAVLRRSVKVDETRSDKFRCKGLCVDFERHEVLVKDKKVDLTLKEFELLEILIKNRGKILQRETLLDKIWGYEYIGETRTVDVHIKTLRKKLKEYGSKIKTHIGVGYSYGD